MGHLKQRRKKGDSRIAGKLLSQSLLTLATTIFIFVVRMAKNVVIARMLGPTLRGVFGLIVLLPEMVASLGNLGFGVGILYYRVKMKWDMREVMGAALFFLAVFGAPLAVLGDYVLGMDVLFKDQVTRVRPFAVYIAAVIPFLLAKRLNVTLIMGEGWIKRYNLLRLVESILPFLLFLSLWFFLYNALTAAVWAWIAAAVAVGAIGFVFLTASGAYPPTWSGELFWKSLRYGFRGHWANFLQFALLRVDFLFISILLSPTELGYYAVSSVVAEILLTIPESVGIPLIPILFNMDTKEAGRLVPLTIRVLFTLMLLACLTMAAIGKPFLHILYGDEFLPAYPALILLMPGIAALGIFPILKVDFFNRNKPGIVSLTTGVALLINLALNFFWIPQWGIAGAAASSSVGYVASVSLLLLIYCRHAGIHVFSVLLIKKSDVRLAVEAFRQRFLRQVD